MNERINELIKQSYKTVQFESGYSQTYFSQEKFAELLLKEVGKVNEEFIGRRIGEIDLDLVYKQHFGVEE